MEIVRTAVFVVVVGSALMAVAMAVFLPEKAGTHRFQSPIAEGMAWLLLVVMVGGFVFLTITFHG